MNWKSHLPEDCPPEDAEIASGIVFRLIRSTPSSESDFLSFRELNPTKTYDLPECIVGGISVYRELSDLISMQNRVPSQRKKKIAKAQLQPNDGKLKNTPSFEPSHHTWWIPETT